MKTKNVLIVLVVWFVLLLPGLVLAQNDFDQQLGQSAQSGQGNEITIHDHERVTIGSSEDGGQDPQDRIIRFGEDQPDQGGSQQYQAPKWETREGLEEAAKAYFKAKNDYNECKKRGDTAGVQDAKARMSRFSRQLDQLKKKIDTFKEQQAARDKAQDELIDATANSVGTLNKQINDQGGINDRLGTVEREVNDYVTPAITGIDGKFAAHQRWLILLSVFVGIFLIIVITGFSRRPVQRGNSR